MKKGLDTFKDIWEQDDKKPTRLCKSCLDTFKDIWELTNFRALTPITPFRYLQGYMGTDKGLSSCRVAPWFRYLQGYMGTDKGLSSCRVAPWFRYLQGYMGTDLLVWFNAVFLGLDTFKDIWERRGRVGGIHENEFRYLQGYMGTRSVVWYIESPEFRYLQGYMGTLLPVIFRSLLLV